MQVSRARGSPENDLGVPLKIFLVNWSVSIITASEPSRDLRQLFLYIQAKRPLQDHQTCI